MSPARPGARPRALTVGARVALVAPAGPMDPERVDVSAERCRQLGLEPVEFPAARSRHRFLGGTDDARLGDLQVAFDDPSIDAVWALRGGYGTQRIVDRLDLSRQTRDPIPFIGFSDNTALHARHAALGVISFHGPHPGADFPPETAASFRSVLFEDGQGGPLPTRACDPAPRTMVEGSAEAPLAGGNLAMVASLAGTRDAVQGAGRILFLEDVGEPAYRLDRMLLQLERSGVTQGVLGVAFGRFSSSGDEHSVDDVLTEWATRLGVPCVADLPFGHVEHNCTLPVGGMAILDGVSAELRLPSASVTSPVS